jgi:tetratricopeptide (TPR) repeat protein
LVWVPVAAFGHGDILAQIEAVGRDIAKDPGTAHLYLKRAELHRVHQDWSAALADYARTEELLPGGILVRFFRGRMSWEAGRPEVALPDLDAYLAKKPTHGEALLIRSRVRAALGDRTGAIADLDVALANLPRPTPEDYLEKARLEAAVGIAGKSAALKTLDTGIAGLGPAPALIIEAISLEAALGRYDAALARIDALHENQRSQPRWLARRGDLLVEAGRLRDAREAYERALDALEALPAARRASRAMRALSERLTEALQAQ